MGTWIPRLRASFRFIVDLTGFVAALIAILTSSVAVAVFAFLSNRQNWVGPILGFLSGIILSLLLATIVYLWPGASGFSTTKWLLRAYKVLEISYLYCIEDDDLQNYSQTTHVYLQALQYGVDLYEGRYGWSGKGIEEPPEVQSRGHKLLGMTSIDGWDYYYVHLGRELIAKDKATVEVKQRFIDEEGRAEPFLAKRILDPTDKLILRVQFPPGVSPMEDISFIERRSGEPNAHIVRSQVGSFDHIKREILWEIQKPVFGHKYAITWSYPPQIAAAQRARQLQVAHQPPSRTP